MFSFPIIFRLFFVAFCAFVLSSAKTVLGNSGNLENGFSDIHALSEDTYHNKNLIEQDSDTECDCGKNSVSCTWSDSHEKICECKDGYMFDVRYRDEGCTYCMNYCNQNAKTCVISLEGTVSCVCKPGFQVENTNYQCEECDCGPYGNCSILFYRRCKCQDGYSENDGICEECDCGPSGSCYFASTWKRCSCKDNFKEKLGKCEECYCGKQQTFCKFGESGEKVCSCNKKHYALEGLCQPCRCGLDVDCEYTNGSKSCHCTDGFEDRDGFCFDIDECLSPEACPTNSYCLNTFGSYDCKCKTGYESLYQNVKDAGCEDIDECSESMFFACAMPETRCVNTIGSYKCVCRKGYNSIYIGSSPKYNTCRPDSDFFKTATIVTGIVLGIGIVAMLAIILKMRR